MDSSSLVNPIDFVKLCERDICKFEVYSYIAKVINIMLNVLVALMYLNILFPSLQKEENYAYPSNIYSITLSILYVIASIYGIMDYANKYNNAAWALLDVLDSIDSAVAAGGLLTTDFMANMKRKRLHALAQLGSYSVHAYIATDMKEIKKVLLKSR